MTQQKDPQQSSYNDHHQDEEALEHYHNEEDYDDDDYQPTFSNYIVFIYFCINCFLLGGPLLNSNAVLEIWKNSDTFVAECSFVTSKVSWCPEQAETAKIALLLFQSASSAMSMMGGALVDTSSAAMCLFVSHVMFAGGAYFLRYPGTRGIYSACLLQGIAGELLLNSVLPICRLFGSRQHFMLLVLTICHDLSVLIYPFILLFLSPTSALATVHEDFYNFIHTTYLYFAIAAAIIGTCILPIDDNGNIIIKTRTTPPPSRSPIYDTTTKKAAMALGNTLPLISVVDKHYYHAQQKKKKTFNNNNEETEYTSLLNHSKENDNNEEKSAIGLFRSSFIKKYYRHRPRNDVSDSDVLLNNSTDDHNLRFNTHLISNHENELRKKTLVEQQHTIPSMNDQYYSDTVSNRSTHNIHYDTTNNNNNNHHHRISTESHFKDLSSLQHQKKRRRHTQSLWDMRLTHQIRTWQFFIAFILFACSLFRISFFLNNNLNLLENLIDQISQQQHIHFEEKKKNLFQMGRSFSWILGLGALFNPISWHINDNYGVTICLFIFTLSLLCVNILIALPILNLQYLTFIIFVFGRISTSSTILTYIAKCFGFRRFPIMSTCIGLLGAIFNFSNILFDESILNNKWNVSWINNIVMIGLGVFCVGIAFFHTLRPILIKSQFDYNYDTRQEQRNFFSPQYMDIDNNKVNTPANTNNSTKEYMGKSNEVLDEDDEWEDEEIIDNTRRI